MKKNSKKVVSSHENDESNNEMEQKKSRDDFVRKQKRFIELVSRFFHRCTHVPASTARNFRPKFSISTIEILCPIRKSSRIGRGSNWRQGMEY